MLYVQASNDYEHLGYSGTYYPYYAWENGRADYVFSEDFEYQIVFRRNKWMIEDDGYLLIWNKNQARAPPERGWMEAECLLANMVVHKVPVTPIPPVISIQGDSIPDIAGIYTHIGTSYTNYPAYESDQGCIEVREEDDNGAYYWYWESKSKRKGIQNTMRVGTKAYPIPFKN